MLSTIKIRGARQHNLKNVDVDIPKNQFVVMTGVSGSGKSSLAFDTIYAEGQRRYVESLSAYARQFLGIMDKPDVDLIEGLSPSISIDQKTVSHNPRSTVGTITEIYDYMRVLYARVGHPHCPNDGIEISKLTADEIVDKIMAEIERQVESDKIAPHSFRILSPVVRQRKGEFLELLENLRVKGFANIIVDGHPMNVNDDIALIKTNKHTILAVIDTFNASHKELKEQYFVESLRPRISGAVEQATKLADGLVILGSDKKEFLYSEKFSCPKCGLALPEIEPRMFSFNSPLGACETCRGLGTVHKVDPDLILNPNLSINEGGIMPFQKFFFAETWYTRLIKRVCEEEKIDMDKPMGKLDQKKVQLLLKGTGLTYQVLGTNRMGKATRITEKFDGLLAELERRYYDSTGEGAGMVIQQYMREEICDGCKGEKLKPEVLAITIDGINIAHMCDFAIDDLIEYFHTGIRSKLNVYELQIAEPIIKEVLLRSRFLQNVGLAYLTVARKAKTLSGGELQRIRLASQIGTGLTGVLYVLDEPSIGLHPRDVSALIKTLHDLKDLGNTLIVVEHDQETIESGDYLVELGPHAGKHGGTITFTGTVDEIKKANSLTGKYLSGRTIIESPHKELVTTKGKISLLGAKQFNLKDVDMQLPLGNLIAVTGVSGSGKSTLVVETLYPALKQQIDGHYMDSVGEHKRLEGFHYVDRVYLVDQGPIGRTPRSNPATYIGFFDEIRDVFANTLDAKARGFDKGRFSFNVKGGRCEKCQGAGVIKIEMQFLSDVYVTCDVCEGHRYNRETLEVKYREKTIFDILKLTVDDAAEFFKNFPKISSKLQFLQKVGLGYIELGQAAPTFSGGEAQRIKLADELSRSSSGRTLYILDEPTTGLHFYDVQKLLNALTTLVEQGNTVLVIEHNMDIVKHCQWVVDMGPEGGMAGGNVVYQGELEGILKVDASYTGQYLKKYLP